jgi:hypothetical protein
VSLTLADLRRAVEATWQDIISWCARKERIFDLNRPEQQILFELAVRLRDTLRQLSGLPSWDRLFFDAAAAGHFLAAEWDRAPIRLDARQLCARPDGIPPSGCVDIAIAVEVLRASNQVIEFDADGRPRNQRWIPQSLTTQGRNVETRVRTFEDLSEARCEGYLFVLYSNRSGRRTPLEMRQVASWATWHQASGTLLWASRHFRAKDAPPSSPLPPRF